jgi:hypothetical protein
MNVLKIVSIIATLSLLCLSLVGCNGTPATISTPPASTAPTSSPPASTVPPISTWANDAPSWGAALYTLQVSPNVFWVAPDSESSFTVTAKYEDARKIDVTKQCIYTSSNDKIASVVIKDTPGKSSGDPPIPTGYILAGSAGSAIIFISYSENGVTLSSSITFNIGEKPLAEKPQPKL